MTDKETQVRDWNERFWALSHRPSEIDFTFRQLTMALAQSWGLPGLIVMLIKGTDTPRAQTSRAWPPMPPRWSPPIPPLPGS